MNKRAYDWPQTILYVFFSMVVLAWGIFIVIGFSEKADVAVTRLETEGIDYNILAARLLDSPTCLALEDSYGQARLGIIYLNKFDATQVKNCIKDVNDFKLELNPQVGGKGTIANGDAPNTEDKYFVKVYDSSTGKFYDSVLKIGFKL